MARLGRVLTAAVIVSAAGALLPAHAGAQAPASQAQNRPTPIGTQVARLASGTIAGSVIDERGGAVAGASVTAIGATMALAVTDDSGRFITEVLPPGEYVLRAHRKGYAASARAVVRVSGPESAAPRLQLRRLDEVAGTSGAASPPLPSRPIVAAGVQLPPAETREGAGTAKGEDGSHPHSETAWRLRHIKRSILKSESSAIVLAGAEPEASDPSLFGRAVGGAASVASFAGSLFADLPLSGEVNLLTTSAFAPGEFMNGNGLPRGIAYFSLGSPTPAGDWTVRAAMSEGDLASWTVAGSFVSKAGQSHSYTVGMSYSAQEYQGGNPVALAAMMDGSRHAGELYGFDRWTVVPWLEVDYGTRYARYGYISDEQPLMSPRLGLTFKASPATRFTALVTQRMVVPGAEEFMPRAITGPALPPERTFAPFEGHDLRVERARGLDLLFEHQVHNAYVLGIRRFQQNVDDQLVTMFRVSPAGSPESVGHYYVANAGSFEASGWAVRVSTPPASRVRGYVDYSVTRAHWSSRNAALGEVVPVAVRPETEDIHDITTSIETDIPETATRVAFLYRTNSAFVRDTGVEAPGMDGRFDLQVNQALPFGPGGTRWEVLVGLRNLFRDANDPASIYDELLVVRPPKRVIGGFLVRF